MASMFSRRIAAWVAFLIGLLLMFLGSAFLLGSLAGTSKFSVLLAFLFVILGILLAVFAIKMNTSSIYLFFASLFLMAGFYLFLSALNVIPRDIFYKTWPLISVFSGLALVPAGWRRYGTFRSRFMAPALVFVILGCALLVFSFGIVDFSFKQFVLNWWPLLIALAGLLLVLVSLGVKNSTSGDEVSRAGDQDQ